MTALYEVSEKTRNTCIYLNIVKIIDMVMTYKWYSIQDKDAQTLIDWVHHLFELHDIFAGSFTASRMMMISKEILNKLLENRKHTLTQAQTEKIHKLLGVDAM